MRGGNTRHTRDIRCAHESPVPFMSGRYPVAELLQDLIAVARPQNRELAALVCAGSLEMPNWLSERGVRWQSPIRGTLHLSRTNLFFLGGGTAAINALYRKAELLGVVVAYGMRVAELMMNGGSARGVCVEVDGARVGIAARCVVITAGGFEANLEWLARYWGDAARNFLVRGTPYNDGALLAQLIELGATLAGDPKGFHATCIDARSPQFDGGIATRLDAVPMGIAVNANAERFADEGEDVWPKRYASWGRLIAEQPGQIIYSICDARARQHFLPSLYPPYQARSIRGLAAALKLDKDRLERTVLEYNASIPPDAVFDSRRLDHCATVGLEPPKSNWALSIVEPPFYAYPIRPGITFTYMGVAVDQHARVQLNAAPIEGLYAAGEIMSGNVLTSGYLAGFGLVIGHVFGRIAGQEAAHDARRAP